MKMRILSAAGLAGAVVVTALALIRCGSTTSSSTTRTVDANTSAVKTVNTAYGSTCTQLKRDTSSCQAAREAMGFSGNWLSFSCNVVLGLVNGSGTTVSTFSSATYVTLTFVDLPDYKSNYYPSTGTYSFTANSATVSGNFSSLYTAYTTSFPDPSYIAQQSFVAKVPITPSAVQTSTAGFGAVGVALNGVSILDSAAANSDNIFAEAGSFDQCQGHPNGQNGGTYHYHSEPYSISYDDNGLIGIMLDGYWIYGRRDHDNTIPATGGTITTYGGHTGADPLSGTGSTFHYHVTEWKTCLDEVQTGGIKTYYSDDGEAACTHMSGGNLTGTLVDAWFLTGQGNGGIFRNPPTGPTNQTHAVRYFYGAPGTCTGC